MNRQENKRRINVAIKNIKVFKTYVPDTRISVFASAIIVGNIIFWFLAGKTDWYTVQTVFFRHTHWTFMDWYPMLIRFQNGIYTGKDVANYPALCFWVWRFFWAFFDEGYRYDEYELRYLQQGMIPMIVSTIILLYFVGLMLCGMLNTHNTCEKKLLVFCVLMSGPFLFLIERANIMIFALLGTLVYVVNYDSEIKWKRYVGYIALSFAAGLKLYPAVFGVLTLEKKRYRETILLLIMGALFFVVPFFSYGGIVAIKAFFDSLMGSFDVFSGEYGFGSDFSIYNLARLIASCVVGYREEITKVPTIVASIILLTSFFTVECQWKKMCVLSLSIVLIPTVSYQYTLCFLIIPLIFMLKTQIEKEHYIYLTEFLLVYFPWVYIPLDKANGFAGEEASHLMGVGNILMYAGLVLMVFTLFASGIISLKKRIGMNRYK